MNAPRPNSWHPWLRSLIATVSFLLVILLLPSCDAPAPDPDPGGGDDPIARASDCVGCHTQEDLLKAVARDEPPPAADTGEG